MLREAEWEYGCRGGATSKEECSFDFYFERPTNDLSSTQANFNQKIGRTTKVGSYKANPLGLYDMHGNVWEWCEDTEGSFRVDRGGSWGLDPRYCRSALRNDFSPSFRFSDLGFRVAVVQPGR